MYVNSTLVQLSFAWNIIFCSFTVTLYLCQCDVFLAGSNQLDFFSSFNLCIFELESEDDLHLLLRTLCSFLEFCLLPWPQLLSWFEYFFFSFSLTHLRSLLGHYIEFILLFPNSVISYILMESIFPLAFMIETFFFM